MNDRKPYTVNGERVTHDEYVKTKYEDLRIRVKKGRKAEIQSHAEKQGKSLNAFVNEAIENQIERDCNNAEGNQ